MSNEQLSVAVGIDTFTPTQLSQLVYLASQCPLAGGASVFRARSLLTLVVDTFFDDKTICEAQGIYFKKEVSSVIDAKPESLELSFMPNPAKDHMFVQAKQNYTELVKVMVTDITGRVMITQQSHFEGKRLKINTAVLSNGVYILRIQNEKGLYYSSRFSVQQ